MTKNDKMEMNEDAEDVKRVSESQLGKRDDCRAPGNSPNRGTLVVYSSVNNRQARL